MGTALHLPSFRLRGKGCAAGWNAGADLAVNRHVCAR